MIGIDCCGYCEYCNNATCGERTNDFKPRKELTNEEKAKEIGEFFETPYLAALEMAEWKDQQFKEYLEKKKTIFHKHYIDSESCSEEEVINYALLIEFKEIIYELFGEK